MFGRRSVLLFWKISNWLKLILVHIIMPGILLAYIELLITLLKLDILLLLILKSKLLVIKTLIWHLVIIFQGLTTVEMWWLIAINDIFSKITNWSFSNFLIFIIIKCLLVLSSNWSSFWSIILMSDHIFIFFKIYYWIISFVILLLNTLIRRHLVHLKLLIRSQWSFFWRKPFIVFSSMHILDLCTI